MIIGKRTDPHVQNILSEIHRKYIPRKVVILVDDQSDEVPVIAKDKKAIDNKNTIYVCHNFVCSKPVTTWEELKPLL